MTQAIKDLINNYSSKISKQADLDSVKRVLSKKYKIDILLNAEILAVYHKLVKTKKINSNQTFEKLLRKRSIRTLSGIAPVAVLTKPYPCPGHCAYCPNEPGVPVSYLSNEPAVMRAIRCGYDPYKQVQERIKALEVNGHKPNKIELIVIGGTWSFLPEDYRYWYIINCFKAANDYPKVKTKIRQQKNISNLVKYLKIEQTRNQTAKYKIIGLTLETRPDYIDEKELLLMRDLGCTRVEIGVQAVSDKILEKNNRGHGVKVVVEATKTLKQHGFKVTYHFMPGLPGSTASKDYQMFKALFTGPRFQPDQIKFYPTVVTKGSLLYKWWQQGKYKPYTDKTLQNLIIKCKAFIPKYVRIIRLIRDIPGESIEAGNTITNLRQIMQDQGVACNCIRCREARDKALPEKLVWDNIQYKASGGDEYFLSLTDTSKTVLYSFCRLRIDKNSPVASAIIRELHVYGELMPKSTDKKVQHQGLGKQLMQEAKKIAKQNKCKKIAVISGVGVRGYYQKLGYSLQDTYMVKELI